MKLRTLFLLTGICLILATVSYIRQPSVTHAQDASEHPFAYDQRPSQEGCFIITLLQNESRQEVCPSESSYDLLMRYADALNRKEYHRAFIYWDGTPPGAVNEAQFAAGFAETAHVEMVVGEAEFVGVAAMRSYVNQPVLMFVTTTSGAEQIFVGCYQTKTLTYYDGVYPGVPHPLNTSTLHRAKVVRTQSADARQLATACQTYYP